MSLQTYVQSKATSLLFQEERHGPKVEPQLVIGPFLVYILVGKFEYLKEWL